MLVPEVTWFADSRLADSLHGVRHNARVSLLASLLGHGAGLDSDQTAGLCTAAAVHDCRRHDDRQDPGHGWRAASWLLQNADTVTSVLDVHPSRRALHEAATAVALHDVPYDAFTADQDRAYRQAPHLIDLLKAADCLDRYRLPRTRWWPDLTRLRVPVPGWLHHVAFDLVLRSEQARLDGATHQQALDHALNALTPDEGRPFHDQ
ncbi:hypothetical protein [Streptacidiphilus sp. PB12-B1b]|uniref:hypothetical protein n=1 Tax=Streptacidiphilus sp. PB12-B1b TaxID=2705012 RepID=UPI001CDD2FFC|nr:hypothetical protein [Streptacidiphilus sp. PB12-B1b]